MAPAVERGDKAALVSGSGDISYRYLALLALRMQAQLRARANYRPGAVVAFRFENSIEYLVCLYGALLAECIAAPLPFAIEARRLHKLLALITPDFVIGGEGDGFDSEHQEILELSSAAPDGPLPELGKNPDDVAMLLLTSGTTGSPKAVMLSHRNLLANADAILRTLPIRSDDRTLVVLPFCHAFGNSILQTHLLTGGTLVLGRPFVFPQAVVDSIEATKATSFSATPEICDLLARYGSFDGRLETLRYMVVAGGAVRHEVAIDIAQRIDPAAFYIMYGQTEATARLTSLSSHDLRFRPGSVGRAIPTVDLAIRDEEGHDLPAGEIGVLHARGDNVMRGYWNDRAATAEAISATGWLRTGDLAHCDSEGFVYLHGRENLLVKIRGHRVHPLEIEELVEEYFPSVRAVAVPSKRANEDRFVLFISSRNGNTVDADGIRKLCQDNLLPYKVPVAYEVLGEIPMTSNLKVDRATLALRLKNDH